MLMIACTNPECTEQGVPKGVTDDIADLVREHGATCGACGELITTEPPP